MKFKGHTSQDQSLHLYSSVPGDPKKLHALDPGGGGNLRLEFPRYGMCHSNRKSTTINPEKFLKSIPINPEKFLESIPINLENF